MDRKQGKYTHQDLRLVKGYREQGLSMTQIGELMNRTKFSVRAACRRLDRMRPKR